MTEDHAARGLLILIVTPRLEDVLVDFLLQQDTVSGFTTTPVSGHGTGHGLERLSLVEQVTGRQNSLQFTLHAGLPVLHALINEIKAKFQNTGMHYILLPVVAAEPI